MWILVADGLLRVLNSAAYFAQGYADDFSILVEGMDLATVCGVMQAALLRVEKWCENHGLSVKNQKKITPRMAHWIYIAVIRPIITHAAVVWWPRVELEIARVLLERLQHWGNEYHPHCSNGDTCWISTTRHPYQTGSYDYLL